MQRINNYNNNGDAAETAEREGEGGCLPAGRPPHSASRVPTNPTLRASRGCSERVENFDGHHHRVSAANKTCSVLCLELLAARLRLWFPVQQNVYKNPKFPAKSKYIETTPRARARTRTRLAFPSSTRTRTASYRFSLISGLCRAGENVHRRHDVAPRSL